MYYIKGSNLRKLNFEFDHGRLRCLDCEGEITEIYAIADTAYTIFIESAMNQHGETEYSVTFDESEIVGNPSFHCDCGCDLDYEVTKHIIVLKFLQNELP